MRNSRYQEILTDIIKDCVQGVRCDYPERKQKLTNMHIIILELNSDTMINIHTTEEVKSSNTYLT